MRKDILLATSLISFILLSMFMYSFIKTTGFFSFTGIDVSISEKTKAKILLVYERFLDRGNVQKIYTELINIGTEEIEGRIEQRIYFYNGSRAELIGKYTDITVPLKPSMRREYSNFFLPPYNGLYYIQARGIYNSRTVETWGSFLVFYNVTAPVNIVEVVYVPGEVATKPVVSGKPKLLVEYPEKIKIYRNEFEMLNIKIKNIGESTAKFLKVYVSSPDVINFEVNPKEIFTLSPNETKTLLLSIYVSNEVPEGTYPFEFEIIGDGIKSGGKIIIEIASKLPEYEYEYIKQKILNYKILITETEKEIIFAKEKGYDIEIANESLNIAKEKLNNARKYLEEGMFENAKNELDNVKKYIEYSKLQLSSAILYYYKVRMVVKWWIIIPIVFTILCIILVIFLKRRKSKKPVLLRGLTETERE